MKKVWIFLVVIIMMMIVTNPNKEEHVQDFMKITMKETGYDVNGGETDLERGMIALGYSLAFNTINNIVTYHNHGVFSTLSKDNYIISVGCMGFIYNRIKEIDGIKQSKTVYQPTEFKLSDEDYEKIDELIVKKDFKSAEKNINFFLEKVPNDEILIERLAEINKLKKWYIEK
jgi:hypothetical protein